MISFQRPRLFTAKTRHEKYAGMLAGWKEKKEQIFKAVERGGRSTAREE